MFNKLVLIALLVCSSRVVYAQEARNVARKTLPLSQFAPTTSAELAGVISNESGTGLLPLQTGSTLINPTFTGTFNPNGTAYTWPADAAGVLTFDGLGAMTIAAPLGSLNTAGAGCDGVGDESALLQGLIDEAVTSGRGTVYINSDVQIQDNIYLYGDVSLIGDRQHRIIIDTDMEVTAAGGDDVIFACGVAAKGDSRSDATVWHGSIDGVNFYGTANARFGRLIFILEGQGCAIVNCDFDFRLFPLGLATERRMISCVEGFNIAAWIPDGTNLREDITISNNRLQTVGYSSQGGEGFGMNWGTNITINNNVIIGCFDDPIAFHFCTTGEAIGNQCYSVAGRIGFTHCSDLRIANNHCERIADKNGVFSQAGGLIMGLLETANASYQHDISIIGNTCKVPAEVVTFDAAIVMRGGQNVSIIGNQVWKEATDIGQAQAGTPTSITLAATASAVDDTFNGLEVVITSGTGLIGERRTISDYTGATRVADVSEAWTTNPDATTRYEAYVLIHGIKFQKETFATWTGSIDGNDTDLPRGFVINGNNCRNSAITMSGSAADFPGPNIISNNTASKFTLVGLADNTTSWNNRLIVGEMYSQATSAFGIMEEAAAPAAAGGQGQLWVKEDSPTSLHFQDDTGGGFQVGDTIGAASSTDNTIPRFDSTTGKLLQSSGIVVSDADFLGIGTTPTNPLHVVNTAVSYSAIIHADTASPGYDGLLILNDSNDASTDALTILSQGVRLFEVEGDGDVGFGTADADFTIDVVGTIAMAEQASADADVAGKLQMWVKDTEPNELWATNDAGTDFQLGAGAGTGTVDTAGSPAVNQIAIFTDADTITGNAGFLFDPATGDMAVGGPTSNAQLRVNSDHTTAGLIVDGNDTGAADGILIDHEGTTGEAIDIDTAATTGAGIDLSADSLTTGRLAYLRSASASAANRRLVELVNTNAAATGATPLWVEQNAVGTIARFLNGPLVTDDVLTADTTGVLIGDNVTFTLPQSAAPTVDTDGMLALDTTVADFSHGVLKHYGGEELAVVSLPIAELTTPTDGHVVSYNATNDEFELAAAAGGGASVMDEIILRPSDSNITGNGYADLGDDQHKVVFDATTDESMTWTNYYVNNYQGGTVKADITYTMASATFDEVILFVQVWAVTPGDSQDIDTPSFDTANTTAADTVPGTAGYLGTVTVTLTNDDSMAEGDLIAFQVGRDADNAGDDATGDCEIRTVRIYEE